MMKHQNRRRKVAHKDEINFKKLRTRQPTCLTAALQNMKCYKGLKPQQMTAKKQCTQHYFSNSSQQEGNYLTRTQPVIIPQYQIYQYIM